MANVLEIVLTRLRFVFWVAASALVAAAAALVISLLK
jgi:hypothetical protein